MAQQFPDGEIVHVKSGGPRMTIAFYDATTKQYTCQWFDGKLPKTGDFNEAVLAKAPPQGPGIVAGGIRR